MLPQKTKNIFLGVTAILAIAGAVFFPTNGLVQKFVSGIVFMTMFPYLVVRFALKESVNAYGLTFPVLPGRVWARIIFFFLLTLGLFLLLYKMTSLGRMYFPSPIISQGFFYFFLYSVVGGGIFSLLYSSFFQGFLLFFFRGLFKEWAILLQWMCFVGFLFLMGQWNASVMPYLYVALFSGTVVSLTRSFPIGFLFMWIFVILADMILLKFF